MRPAGFQPSDELLRALEVEKSDDAVDVTRLRGLELRRMILLGKVDAAKAFLRRLERNGVASDPSDKEIGPLLEQDRAFTYL